MNLSVYELVCSPAFCQFVCVCVCVHLRSVSVCVCVCVCVHLRSVSVCMCVCSPAFCQCIVTEV